MHRLVIALLAALDAAIAAIASLAFIVAPLALFWAFQVGGVWGALWPTGTRIWQLGHFVPLAVSLDDVERTGLGLPAGGAAFVISLAPLAFAAFAAIFAARSGARAVRAGSWITGVIAGAITYGLVGAFVAVTSTGGFAQVALWQALLFPVLVYAIPLLLGALVTAWRDGDQWIVDALHDRVDRGSEAWSETPALLGRGVVMLLVGFVGLGALGLLLSILTRGGQMISLFQSAGVDGWGAFLLTLAHFAYLPTLIVWAFAWLTGPGFAVGAGTAVAPSGTELGVVPGLPVFGLIPQTTSPWFLVVVLVPIALAVAVGWHLRGRYVAVMGDREPYAPRVALTAALAVIAAAASAVLAALASGSIGVGRMTELGPNPGALALAVGLEVAVGAGIMLLAPRRSAAVGNTL